MALPRHHVGCSVGIVNAGLRGARVSGGVRLCVGARCDVTKTTEGSY